MHTNISIGEEPNMIPAITNSIIPSIKHFIKFSETIYINFLSGLSGIKYT